MLISLKYVSLIVAYRVILLALWGKESMFEYTRTVYYCVRLLTLSLFNRVNSD